jgi:hypothetical protein
MSMCMNCGCRGHHGITCEHAMDKKELKRLTDENEALREHRNDLAIDLWSAEDQWGDDYLWSKWKLSLHLTEALKKEINK